MVAIIIGTGIGTGTGVGAGSGSGKGLCWFYWLALGLEFVVSILLNLSYFNYVAFTQSLLIAFVNMHYNKTHNFFQY